MKKKEYWKRNLVRKRKGPVVCKRVKFNNAVMQNLSSKSSP